MGSMVLEILDLINDPKISRVVAVDKPDGKSPEPINKAILDKAKERERRNSEN